MRYIFLLLMMLSITACESKEEIEKAQEAEAFKQAQLAEVEESINAQKRAETIVSKTPQLHKESLTISDINSTQEENRSIINNLGFSMDDGRLIIDTKKAKAFFTQLADNLKSTDKKLQEGNLTITKPMGIEVNKTTINIDINKTESYLNILGKKMGQFSQEFESFTKTLQSDNNNTKE